MDTNESTAEETLSSEVAAREPTYQMSFKDSTVPTETLPKGIETSPQGDLSSEAQVTILISRANQTLDSVAHQHPAVHLDSHLDVPHPVEESAPAPLDSIEQLTVSDKMTKQGVEHDETRSESAETTRLIEEEKPNRAVFVLDERSANERGGLRGSQEELTGDVEIFNELSDLVPQGIEITSELNRRVPTYRPLAPVVASPQTGPRRSSEPTTSPTNFADLRLRLQLHFERGGNVELNLVADRRDQMPDEVEVLFTQGKLLLVRRLEDSYEPVSLSVASSALNDGVEWHGRADSRQFRWTLSRRELHVLAEGDVSGLYPFGSTARLHLNARHVVLAAASLGDDVLAALSEAGCHTLEPYDENTPGVPAGWLLIRNVVPTRAVRMREGSDILNALCPLPDVEPHFVGGIYLERGTWLCGHPPQIRLTGDLSGIEIKLDGQPAIVGSDGGITASDWDAEGNHQLWFGGQTHIYTLRTIEENWQRWPAIDFRMGSTICGASVQSSYRTQGSHQVRVTAANPLLVGARPGEVFYFHRPDNVCSEKFLICIPFKPVWSLPSDPAHAHRGTSRIVLLESSEPILPEEKHIDSSRSKAELQRWVSVLNAASKKRLLIEPANKDAVALWLRYRALAKQLRRRLR